MLARLLFAALAFRSGWLATWIRTLLQLSGVLALDGLSGVVFSDLRLRNTAFVRSAGAFPIATLWMAVVFRRSATHPL